jgi:hypothetical protein
MPTTLMTIAPAGGFDEPTGSLGEETPLPPQAEIPRIAAAATAARTIRRMMPILS